MLNQVSKAADLVPPPGYYAAVGERKGSAGSCPARCLRRPTGSLVFTSKYEDSDSARTLNVKAEKTFRSQIEDITDMERGATKLVTQYMRSSRDGDPGLRTELDERLGPRRRPAERRLEPHRQVHAQMGAGRPLRRLHAPEVLQLAAARGPRQRPGKSRTVVRPARHPVVRDWSGLPLKKINNHSYWAAWSVMSTAVVTNRRDLFLDWAVSEFKVAANQVDEQGFLPNELKRAASAPSPATMRCRRWR